MSSSRCWRKSRTRGPLRPGDLENHSNASRGPWWDWSDAKLALEALFFTGRLTVASRVNFIRHYDLPERVLPPEIVAAEVDEVTARRQLLKQAVRHHGIGTVADIARLLPDEESDRRPAAGRDGR